MKNKGKDDNFNIFKTAKEIHKKEQKKKNQAIYDAYAEKANQISKKREEYAKKLHQDKIELMRAKQNNIDLEFTKDEIPSPKMTLLKRISNFFYHKKWILMPCAIALTITSILIYDVINTLNPDAIIMIISNDTMFYSEYDDIYDLFETYIDDYNNDKKTILNLYHMPITNSDQTDMLAVNRGKLSAELELGNALIIIADSSCDDFIYSDSIFLNLEDYFPDNENIDNGKLYLKNTKFTDKLGYENEIPDDLYIAIRKVQTNASYSDKMQKNFDNIFPAFKQFIQDIS